MRLSAVLVGLVIVSVARASASAQALTDLRTGDRIRVRGVEPSDRGDRVYVKTGQLAGIDSRHLVLVPERVTTFDSLPIFAMTSVMVSRGVVPRAKVMRVGALTGASMGLAFWFLTSQRRRLLDDTTSGNLEKYGKIAVPAFTLLGISVGALSRGETWLNVHLPMPYTGKP